MADRDDFDASVPSTWTSDGTEPLDPNSDSAWLRPEAPPPPDAPVVPPPDEPPPDMPAVPPSDEPPPDMPAVPPPDEPPPDVPVVETRAAPPPDAPVVPSLAARPPAAPPPDVSTVEPPVPPPAPWTLRRRRSRGPLVPIVIVAVLGVLGAALYAVGHSVRHRLSGPSLPKHCAAPTYHLSNAATPAPRVAAHPATGTPARTSTRHHLAFTVPRGWRPESNEDVLDGYEDRCGNPQVVLSGVAKYGTGYCAAAPRDFRAIAGFRAAQGEHDLAAVAGQAATAWATWAYAGKNDEQPQVVVSRSRPITLHGTRGSLVRATASGTVPLECGAQRGVVFAVAVDSAAGADVFVIAANQGDPADPSETELLAVAASVRRAA